MSTNLSLATKKVKIASAWSLVKTLKTVLDGIHMQKKVKLCGLEVFLRAILGDALSTFVILIFSTKMFRLMDLSYDINSLHLLLVHFLIVLNLSPSIDVIGMKNVVKLWANIGLEDKVLSCYWKILLLSFSIREAFCSCPQVEKLTWRNRWMRFFLTCALIIGISVPGKYPAVLK